MEVKARALNAAIALMVIVSMLLACNLAPGQLTGETTPTGADVGGQAATGEPTAKPPTPDVPYPPVVVRTMPEQGEELSVAGPIQITFDQAMDAESVEAAFSIKPVAEGDFSWADEKTLLFTPSGKGLKHGTRYRVTVSEEAESAEGLAMQTPFTLAFPTTGFLEVSSVQPVGGTDEVEQDAVVMIAFNRPVVALSAIEDLASLPQPLTFVPPVKGKGEWLNTSIYRFTPDEGFKPSTTYKARIAGGLEDLMGAILEEDYAWEFSTVTPRVVSTLPNQDEYFVSTTPVISVAFNQPMDRESVEKAFSLVNTRTREEVSGTFKWVDRGITPRYGEDYYYYDWEWSQGKGPQAVGVETMEFTPDSELDFGVLYDAEVEEGVNALDGETGMRKGYGWAFTTIPYPAIVKTFPSAKSKEISPWQNIEITFSSPIDPDSIAGKLKFTPYITETDVYSYWWDSNTVLNISIPMDASSEYELAIDKGIKGRYGHPITDTKTISWKTSAYSAMAYLHSPYRIGTYSAYTATMAYVSVRNTSRVDFELYRLPSDDFFAMGGSGDWWDAWNKYEPDEENLIREWSKEVSPPLNESVIYGVNLASDEDKTASLEPGLYYLVVSVSPEAIYGDRGVVDINSPSRVMMVVSKYNVLMKQSSFESLAWVTDLQTGEPVPDADVSFVGPWKLGVMDEDTTDKDGVVAFEHDEVLSVWDDYFTVVGDIDEPGDDFAVGCSRWEEGISSWEFDLPSESYEEGAALAHLFTDRPIYRPGQEVYFKAVLRDDDDAHYTIPGKGEKVFVSITDGFGDEVYSKELSISEMGTVNDSINLDEDAALGYYNIFAEYNKQDFYGSFQVAEYRKPEFQVSVETDKPEYLSGEKVRVTAQASYFFGGPVVDADVRWTVLSEDFYFPYTGKGWYSFVDYDYDSYWGGYYGGGDLIEEGTGTTDEEGRFTFEVDADIANYISSRSFMFEVSVTDVNDQVVSERTNAVIHKGMYYIGMKPTSYIGKTGEESSVDIITVDWESRPSPEQELEVVFIRHKWYTVRKQAEDGQFYWDWDVEETPVYTTTVTTDEEGAAQTSFEPEEGGVYRVRATGEDEKGNEVRSSVFMWVSGYKFINWRQQDNNRIDLIADSKEYNVGDTAKILVAHPFQGEVKALITLERGHIYEYRVQTLETNSEQIEIEITEDMIPNMFVSVVIAKGVDETTRGLPAFRMGEVKLAINNTEKQINIAMKPDRDEDEYYRPGETVTYDVETTDSDGRPVQAELALSLADLSVLSLVQEDSGAIVSTFWRERGLGVRTGSGLTISGDRVNVEVAPEAKGGGGGGGFDEEFGTVRHRFPDTAYWNPTLTTDKDGKAKVEVELPDSLTTWRMRAIGVTADTLVGDSTVDVVSTKDVLARPVAPRFFVVGDEVEIAMVVHNNTAKDLDMKVAFEAEGLEVTDGPGVDDRVAVKSGGNERVAWKVTALDSTETTLRFGVSGGEYKDAVEITVPVYRYSTPEVVATAGQLAEDGSRLEGIVLPERYDESQGELTVQLDPSLAVGMIDGLKYLEHYPYECTEQTVSRFLPNAVTYRASKELGLDLVDEKELERQVSIGLQRLYSQQHYDGGWGWWRLDESNAYLSAYVLLGMVEADRAGFTVDKGVMRRAAEYIDAAYPGQVSRPDSQAFILYVLAEAEEGDLGRTVKLFEQREKLDYFGRAYLAMALGILEGENSRRVETLLSDLASAAIVSATGAHWEEERVSYWAMNTDTRSTAIILAAISRLDPENALGPQTVRWLMVARREGYWETTQETAWSIIGLTDWMAATGELEGRYNYTVTLNGEELGGGSVTPEKVRESLKLQAEVKDLLADEVNRLVIERTPPDVGDSAGRLYYSMYLRYFKPVEDVTALDRGIIVSRSYSLASDEKGSAIDGAQVGDIIQVRLTIVAPNDLHYLVVEDPFPGGAEGVDESLKITSVVGEEPTLTRTDRRNPWGGGYGWWWFSNVEMRDEKMVLFATYLPRGTYEYTYMIRASVPGKFGVIPANAYEMYFPEVFGRSDGGLFTIER